MKQYISCHGCGRMFKLSNAIEMMELELHSCTETCEAGHGHHKDSVEAFGCDSCNSYTEGDI